MSDSEEEDEESESADKQLVQEARELKQELKRQKQAALPLAQRVQNQVLEKVTLVKQGVTQAVQKASDAEARTEAIRGVNTKVRGMLTNAFTKFNEIVERNKANIPEIDIADMLA